MSELGLWGFLAGLGLFLFGMELLESSLKSLAGRSLRDFLKRNTKNRFRAIASGAIVTAVLQSSTLVSLMTLAFVGAGLLKMSQAIAVVLGTNLGTTATGWIFALVGFKLNIQTITFVLLGVGALARLLTSSDHPKNWNRKIHFLAQFVLGFALLFIGLEHMKDSISGLAADIDYTQYQNWPVYSFALVGFVLTAIIQSSSATMAITLSILTTGVISFQAAAGIIIGAYLGTTLTILLGAIGGSSDRKRVALAHFLFNLTTSLVALLVLPFLTLLITKLMKVSDPLIALVTFHSMVSTLGILIFAPFMTHFAKRLYKILPDKDSSYSNYISKVPPSIHGPAIEALEKELLEFFNRTLWYNFSQSIGQDGQQTSKELRQQHMYNYQELKAHSSEIYDFCYQLLEDPNIEEKEVKRVQEMLRTTRLLLYSARALKNVTHHMVEFLQKGDRSCEIVQSWNQEMAPLYQELIQILEQLKIPDDQSFLQAKGRIEALDFDLDQMEEKWGQQLGRLYLEKGLNKSDIPALVHLSQEALRSFNDYVNALELWIPNVITDLNADLD